ncbi:MAG TPA: amidohydrolase [Thermoflexia bacterium]|nr:amidohydrolase [Thermoflexia bacterium]
MNQKKLKVDTIVTAATVITMDAEYTLYTPGAVAITGDSITVAGPQAEILATYQATERVDAGDAVVMPGLINTHGHAPMTLLRGLADDLRLDVWLMGYIMPVERDFVDAHFCWLGTQLATAEMIRSGTTTFLDMYYFEDAVADATALAGLRGVCAQSILKFPSPDATSYEETLAKARDYIIRWQGHPLVIPALAPHAPYTVTPQLLRDTVALAQEFDVPLHIHVAETADEVQNHRQQYGMPIVPWLKKLGVLDTKCSLAHCVHLDAGEISTLKHHHVGVAHNPSSNLKLASGIAPVAEMLAAGLNVGIGTDGAASNNDLDMFEELRLASFLAKLDTMSPVTLPARQTLAMATIMGARALHIDELTGSLEPGKRADLIVVRMDDMRHTPQYNREPENVYSRLVYASHAEDVQHVMVNGRWLLRERELLTLEPASLRAEADQLAGKIDTFLAELEESVLRKLIAIGGVNRKETFEIQVKVRQPNLADLRARIKNAEELTFLRGSQRNQYDTYFLFEDRWGSVLRYREDEVLATEPGQISDIIYRLTLTTRAKEREYQNSVLLSRSRFDAPANRSLRFYQEYFQPDTVIEVQKERERYHLRYRGTEFAVNLDHITTEGAEEDVFFEIKSRTWSRQDAEHKALLIGKLLTLLEIPTDAVVKEGYSELIR